MKKTRFFILHIVVVFTVFIFFPTYAKAPQFELKNIKAQMTENVAVVGHCSPDTDSAVSAVTYARLLIKLGFSATPFLAGPANDETIFVFKYFNETVPEILSCVDDKNIILVDHNDYKQAVPGMDKARIRQIVDHHCLGGIKTPDPLYVSFMPLGSGASVVYNHYIQNRIKIDKNTAGLLLSAILSDTMLLKSPTCTDFDRQIAVYLSKIAGIKDINKYGMEMLKAGYNLEPKTDEELFYYDFKVYSKNGVNFAVAQLFGVDDNVLARLQKRMAEYGKQMLGKRGEKMIFYIFTNVLTCNSTILGLGDGAKEICNKAFNSTDTETEILKGIVSRKKQVIPALMGQF